jgi:MFS family permease
MYSDADLTDAVASGAITQQAADGLRAFVANRQATSTPDEEQFRLLTGFNDIFVSIATVLLLTSAWWLAGSVTPLLSAATLAALSWALAEYFTRRRRMALPSILLLGTFTGGMFAFGLGLSAMVIPHGMGPDANTWPIGAGAIVAVAATVAHWRRFHVPITIAAGAVAAVGAAIAVLLGIWPHLERGTMAAVLICGLVVFALAMRWDMSDRTRTTRRSDVAFWLHLSAAPLIVHPAFKLLGLLDSDGTDLSRAAVAVGVYGVLALVALVVDRRALLVSALFYVVYAIGALLKAAGALSFSLALTALVAGSALLVLSAFWHPTRRAVLAALPASLRGRVPPA